MALSSETASELVNLKGIANEFNEEISATILVDKMGAISMTKSF